MTQLYFRQSFSKLSSNVCSMLYGQVIYLVDSWNLRKPGATQNVSSPLKRRCSCTSFRIQVAFFLSNPRWKPASAANCRINFSSQTYKGKSMRTTHRWWSLKVWWAGFRFQYWRPRTWWSPWVLPYVIYYTAWESDIIQGSVGIVYICWTFHFRGILKPLCTNEIVGSKIESIRNQVQMCARLGLLKFTCSLGM